MRAALHLFEERVAPDPYEEIYLTEQVTPLCAQFRLRHPRLIASEYLVGSTPKGCTDASGVRCEDMTDLSFEDAELHHLLSFEVLEHIPDYRAALRECPGSSSRAAHSFALSPFTEHRNTRSGPAWRLTERSNICSLPNITLTRSIRRVCSATDTSASSCSRICTWQDSLTRPLGFTGLQSWDISERIASSSWRLASAVTGTGRHSEAIFRTGAID